MELGAHDVMVVAGEDAQAGAGLPVPDADRLVVARAQDPGAFSRVELNGADVIEMAKESEQAPTFLEVPHLDLVIVSSADEQWLNRMETD